MSAGPEYVPSSPELHSDTPLVAAATPPFTSGDVTPGFQPCPSSGPATACRWPVCGHSYHALCLARSRAHVVLRALPPVASLAFAECHDAAIAACVVDLLGTKLGGSGLFSAPCLLQSDGAGRVSQGASHTVGRERRHNGRVNRKLRSIPQGQAVGNDLDAAVVKTCDRHIHIAHK